jgi:CheY-like chemotaxis protein
MLQQLREVEAYKDLPIVALTASVMNEEVAKLRRAGFSGVLAKPLDPDQFPDLFRRILEGEQIWNIV